MVEEERVAELTVRLCQRFRPTELPQVKRLRRKRRRSSAERLGRKRRRSSVERLGRKRRRPSAEALRHRCRCYYNNITTGRLF
jgi:hypothetical protein